jgi:hypothetical protein
MRERGDWRPGEATAARQPPSDDLGRRNLRLVYSRARIEVAAIDGPQQLDPSRSAPASRRSRPSGSGTRDDWPSWLTGTAVWELTVLIAMFTLLLIVGRRKSAWS